MDYKVALWIVFIGVMLWILGNRETQKAKEKAAEAKEKSAELIKDMIRENEKNLAEARESNKLLQEIIYLLKSK